MPKFVYRVIFVPKTTNHPNQADQIITFVKADSEIAKTANAAYAVIRETERPKWIPSPVVAKVNRPGFGWPPDSAGCVDTFTRPALGGFASDADAASGDFAGELRRGAGPVIAPGSWASCFAGVCVSRVAVQAQASSGSITLGGVTGLG